MHHYMTIADCVGYMIPLTSSVMVYIIIYLCQIQEYLQLPAPLVQRARAKWPFLSQQVWLQRKMSKLILLSIIFQCSERITWKRPYRSYFSLSFNTYLTSNSSVTIWITNKNFFTQSLFCIPSSFWLLPSCKGMLPAVSADGALRFP